MLRQARAVSLESLSCGRRSSGRLSLAELAHGALSTNTRAGQNQRESYDKESSSERRHGN